MVALNILKRAFTILCISTPIINIYNINGILVQDILFIVLFPFLIYSLFANFKGNLLYKPTVFMFVYVLIHFLLIYIFDTNNVKDTMVSNTLHYIFYLFLVMFFVKKFFDIDLAIKCYKYFCIFATMFIFLQFILGTIFNYYLQGTLPFFETVADEYSNIALRDLSVFRPRSIFGEPAGYGIYISIFLAINLFTEKRSIKDYSVDIFLTIGVVLSRSSTGILLCLLLWVFKGFIRMKVNLKRDFAFIIYLIFGILIIGFPVMLFFINSDTYSLIIDHIFGTGTNGLGFGTLNRIGNYKYVFSTIYNSNIEILFGHGMRELDFYNPGIPRLFYYFGVTGTFIWIAIFVYIFLTTGWLQRRVLLMMILIAFFSDTLFGIQPTIYFPLIIMLYKLRPN